MSDDSMSGVKKPSFSRRVPEGDDKERLVCLQCGHVQYDNPKIVVGAVVRHEGRILMCRRAIEPRSGYWTLPAGYLELGESPEEGACREAREEATADIAIDRLLAIYSIGHIHQVQLIFTASLVRPEIAPGPESAELHLFSWDEIPWDDLAFPSVRWALAQFRTVEEKTDYPPFGNPSDDDGFDPVLGRVST
jgi:ADP-ribose pyrophosphatase YjhB (NUDIX family)